MYDFSRACHKCSLVEILFYICDTCSSFCWSRFPTLQRYGLGGFKTVALVIPCVICIFVFVCIVFEFVFCSLYGCYSSGTGLPLMWVSHMSPNSALLSVTRFSIYREVWKSGKSHQRSPTDQQDLCQRRTVMMRQWKFQAGRVLARPSQFCTLLCSNASAPVYLCCNSQLSLLFVHHLHCIELADIPIASEK